MFLRNRACRVVPQESFKAWNCSPLHMQILLPPPKKSLLKVERELACEKWNPATVLSKELTAESTGFTPTENMALFYCVCMFRRMSRRSLFQGLSLGKNLPGLIPACQRRYKMFSATAGLPALVLWFITYPSSSDSDLIMRFSLQFSVLCTSCLLDFFFCQNGFHLQPIFQPPRPPSSLQYFKDHSHTLMKKIVVCIVVKRHLGM